MSAETMNLPLVPRHDPEKAMVWALRLAHAENALRMFTSGQADAIIDPEGKTYLLRPAQEHLRQKERRLQALIDSIPDIIATVDRGGAILSKSASVKAVLGYEPAELVGSNFFKLVHDDDLPRVHAAFFNVAEELHQITSAQFRLQAADGSYCLMEATAGKMRDASSESVVFSMRRALVTVPQFQETLRVVRKELSFPTAPLTVAAPSLAQDHIFAMLSHELRTPLTPVLMGIFELQEDERFADARPVLAMIRRNVELESRLLDELIDFTTVGQHKVRLQIAPIDAHEHVRFVLEICQSEIDAANIEVLLHLGAERHIVVADSARLQQVMWNLVKNAVKFSEPGSSIVVTSANETPDSLTLQIADHGVGIEPELLSRLFEPFQQGDLQHYGGLGLGMYIAKGLAEALGGTLTVSSQGRGLGTTFRLTLQTAEIDTNGQYEISHEN